jgi:DNA-binding MarR family transcriptional regulator
MTKSDYETLAAFRYELRKFLHFSECAAAGQELTPQQYLALLVIKGFPERERVTVGELAEHLQITHHGAVGLVNRLQERDLVAREASEEDRRYVFISLTPEGNRILKKLASVHQAELRKIGPLLVRLLNRVAEAGNPGE